LGLDGKSCAVSHDILSPYVCIVYWIEVNLKILKITLINRTRFRTKGQSAGFLCPAGVCCFVFIKPILGNRYGPGVIP